MGANIGTTVTTQILRLANLEGDTGGGLFLELCKPSNFFCDPCRCRHNNYNDRKAK